MEAQDRQRFVPASAVRLMTQEEDPANKDQKPRTESSSSSSSSSSGSQDEVDSAPVADIGHPTTIMKRQEQIENQ